MLCLLLLPSLSPLVCMPDLQSGEECVEEGHGGEQAREDSPQHRPQQELWRAHVLGAQAVDAVPQHVTLLAPERGRGKRESEGEGGGDIDRYSSLLDYSGQSWWNLSLYLFLYIYHT